MRGLQIAMAVLAFQRRAPAKLEWLFELDNPTLGAAREYLDAVAHSRRLYADLMADAAREQQASVEADRAPTVN